MHSARDYIIALLLVVWLWTVNPIVAILTAMLLMAWHIFTVGEGG